MARRAGPQGMDFEVARGRAFVGLRTGLVRARGEAPGWGLQASRGLLLAGFASLGCAGAPAAPEIAPGTGATPEGDGVAEAAATVEGGSTEGTVFTCGCAVAGGDEAPSEVAACTLTVRQATWARLRGMARTEAGEAPVTADWEVVPVPQGRLEPEPFVSFRGPLAIGERSASVEVWFIDNLMYQARLADAGQTLHVTCNPP